MEVEAQQELQNACRTEPPMDEMRASILPQYIYEVNLMRWEDAKQRVDGEPDDENLLRVWTAGEPGDRNTARANTAGESEPGFSRALTHTGMGCLNPGTGNKRTTDSGSAVHLCHLSPSGFSHTGTNGSEIFQPLRNSLKRLSTHSTGESQRIRHDSPQPCSVRHCSRGRFWSRPVRAVWTFDFCHSSEEATCYFRITSPSMKDSK